MLTTSRYFIERGKWDDTLETFINSDGDPSQFAVSPSLPYLVLLCLLPNSMCASPYRPQHGM
jgi:hypothetical protein